MPEHHHPGRTIEDSAGHAPEQRAPGAIERVPASRALPSGQVPQQGASRTSEYSGDAADSGDARRAENGGHTGHGAENGAASAGGPEDPEIPGGTRATGSTGTTQGAGAQSPAPSDGGAADGGASEASGEVADTDSASPLPRAAGRRAATGDARTRLAPATPAAVHGLLGIAVTAQIVAFSGVLKARAAHAVSWIAVDTILTVAAFCLTAALARSLHHDGIRALPAYYVRRFKQTVPWLAAVLLAVVAIAYRLSPLPEAREIRRTVFAGLLQVANWEPLARTPEGAAAGFGPDAAGPLSGVWLLSVLGQFFLVWPLVLTVLFLISKRRAVPVAVLTLGGFAASAMLAAKLWESDDAVWTALGTQTRLVDLCAGATAALIAHAAAVRAEARGEVGSGSDGKEPRGHGGAVGIGSAFAALVGTAALAGAGWYVYRHPDGLLFDGRDVTVGAAVACAAAATALALASAAGPLARVYGNQVTEELGRMAYAVLLLFPPLVWLLRHGWHGISDGAVLGIGAVVTWLLALIVHYTGFRAGRRRWRGWTQRLVVLAVVAAVGAGAYRLPVQLENELRPDGRPLVIGLGDGLAGDLASGLADGSERLNGVSGVDAGRADCGILDAPRIRDRTATEREAPSCGDWREEWARQLVEKEPDAVILHLGRDAAQPLLQGTWRTACAPEYRSLYLGLLDEALRLIESHTDGVPVVVLNERLDNSWADPIDTACFNQRIKEFADTHKGRVLMADLDAYLCASGACRIGVPGGRAFYTALDSHRLTPEGRGFAAGWVEEQVAKARAVPGETPPTGN